MLFATNAIANNTNINTNSSADLNSLNIKSAELVSIEDGYVLNADVDIKFSHDMEEAIIKGFELNFLVEFQLVTPQKYWFDDEIVTVTHRISLNYHALSRQYLLIRDDQQKTFATLNEAVEDLSKIRDLKVLLKTDVVKGEPYNAALLMRLDHTKLPKALQVDAISSDDWKMISQRFEWSPNLFK
ncbi:MAG TPA: DUF4390 domain-containing protein [Methylotenera sp.]|nr:DUF4390 domain-containing protein [Methylotenera sp.]